ncbi:hypothetical protein [Synoicihabitans lomoniglobus]|uniref:Uncharacterized protein n=1 Tax=Synoicihabitans lomoniglobus TaxID=2909285 RepID=A0AAF0A187_9BACT|nr:hypothetical protein [Opitutaceae bacterium LMO-M01]WED65563.1 hypothetical protein PXH66_01700 [Opitutaceae bacterium LMO-M01]
MKILTVSLLSVACIGTPTLVAMDTEIELEAFVITETVAAPAPVTAKFDADKLPAVAAESMSDETMLRPLVAVGSLKGKDELKKLPKILVTGSRLAAPRVD